MKQWDTAAPGEAAARRVSVEHDERDKSRVRPRVLTDRSVVPEWELRWLFRRDALKKRA